MAAQNGQKEESELFLDNSEESNVTVGSCMLCEKNVRIKDFPKIIIKALSRKYCSNLNQFFYTKDINKILSKQRYLFTIIKTISGPSAYYI